jgi:putative peptidoglycan lipid II flippase
MSVARTALFLVPVAIFARGAGFVVPIVIASWFGVGLETDAFFFALSVPSVLLVLAANAMGTVVVPPLAHIRVHSPQRLPGVVTGAALASALLSSIVGTSFALLMPFLLPSWTTFDPPTQAMAVRFTWMLLPFVFFVGALSVIRAACEGMGAFRRAALSPVARAVAVFATVYLGFGAGANILPVAMGAGAVAEFVWLVAVLHQSGVRLAAPQFPEESLGAFRALGPVLLGEAMVALNLVVDKMFAAGLPDGAVTILEYADRARLGPQTLLEASLLPVAFQTWARARALGDESTRHHGAKEALRWVFLLAPPVLAGMVVGRHALVRLMFFHGAFPEARLAETADTMAWFVPAIFASLVGALLVKAHIVAGRYRLVLALGCLSLATNALLNVAFRPAFGIEGLAASTSVTTLIVTVVSWHKLGTGRPARDGLIMLGVSALGAVLLAPLEPTSIASPLLWICAIPFCMALGAGVWLSRRPA